MVLKPLEDAAELRRVVVTRLRAGLERGHAGIDELAQQTRELLSGAVGRDQVFPQRIAFNLIPKVGDFLSAAARAPSGRSNGRRAAMLVARRPADHRDLRADADRSTARRIPS